MYHINFGHHFIKTKPSTLFMMMNSTNVLIIVNTD